MSRPIVARATSLAASTGLLALAIAGALSVSTTVQQLITPDTPAVASYVDPPYTPPPIIHPTTPPPIQRNVVDDSAPPTQTQDPPGPITPINFDPPAPPGPPTITDPRWLREPRDLAHYYPARAQQMGVEGAATLDCRVAVSGQLNCAVISESPQGWNFGAAALRISQDFRMAPALRDGQAVEARYSMRIPFQIPR